MIDDEARRLELIGAHLAATDPSLSALLTTHRRAAPAAITAGIGVCCLLLAFTLASTPLFVVAVVVLTTGWLWLWRRLAPDRSRRSR